MYCNECGEYLSEGSNFCKNCGTSFSNTKNYKVDLQEYHDNTSEYTFVKSKSILALATPISVTKTTAIIRGTSLEMNQTKRTLAVIKKCLFNTKVNVKEIDMVTVKKSMDTSDLIFSIIFGVLSLFNPLLLIIVFLFLWSGYGKKIGIHVKNNRYSIPCRGTDDVDIFINKIKEVNTDVILRM